MQRTICLLTLELLLAGCFVRAQTALATRSSSRILLKASRILNIKAGHYMQEAGILVEGDRIKEVGRAADVAAHATTDVPVLDLGSTTVLPGLVDCHTHLMARIPKGPDGYILNLATKSHAFRALEIAADARVTLQAGFTSVRDVENEGSEYADVALRDAINEELVDGPRMQVATRAIAALGQYNPCGVSPDLLDFPTGAQMISGAD